MKKIFTAVLASVMLLQTAICVSAAPIDLRDLEVLVKPQINLFVKEEKGSNLAWASTVIISSGEEVSLKADIRMQAVRNAFAAWYEKAKALSNETMAKSLPITGEFSVKLEYPDGVTLPPEVISRTDMSDFGPETNNIFVANGTRNYTPSNLSGSGNQELTIPFKVKDGITVGTLYNYKQTYGGSYDYYPEMEIVVPADVTAAYREEDYHIYGYLEGYINVAYDGANHQIAPGTKINFEHQTRPEAIIRFATSQPGSGGSVKYTLSFDSNGGSSHASESHRKGNVVSAADLPIPVREGYVFVAWYLDEELTQKVDTITMDKNIKLYAGWRAKEGPGGPVPEMLNGDDHFAYVIGYPDGTVQPYGSITRAEVVTIFFRLLKDDVRDSNLTYENNYSDVAEGSWYNGAISTMTALGIVNGKSGDKFAPNDDITRGEFAAIVSRFADKAAEISHDFTDVDGHWAESDIYNAAAHGWILGYEDDTFRPDRDITRAEAMTLINRVCARVPETTADLLDDMAKWSDNMDTSIWYYIAVQEATNSHVYERKENEYEKWTEMRENRDWAAYEK